MAQTVEMPISGQATANVKVNLRQGAPSIQAPVLRKLNAQMSIPVQAIVVGDNVQGNPHWYRTSDNAYAWAGAFAPLQSTGAAPTPPSPPPRFTPQDAWTIVQKAFQEDDKPVNSQDQLLTQVGIKVLGDFRDLLDDVNDQIWKIDNRYGLDYNVMYTWEPSKTTVAAVVNSVENAILMPTTS